MSWILKLAAILAMSLGFNGVSDYFEAKYENLAALTATPDALGSMLEDVGFAAQPQFNPDGSIGGYKVDLVSGEQMVPVYFQISEDRKTVTVTAQLTPIRKLDSVPAQALAGLLRQNNLASTPFVIGMNEHFVVTMQFTKPLGGLTAVDLIRAIDKLQEAIDLSAELWRLDCFVDAQWKPDDPSH